MYYNTNANTVQGTFNILKLKGLFVYQTPLLVEVSVYVLYV
jgi:hypothetical protein